ncbi:MAG TPA: hypothetical protein DDY52_03525 [Candidatus Moranbacteria bacterium]|nr:MAG: hypothetical protein UR51_C0022G0027 [Candidatus Moranbacteria bacterium GW2011_GWF1_34_10]HBI17192.1 hypothetical protein [Candidatus Moranbacteria bacterium]
MKENLPNQQVELSEKERTDTHKRILNDAEMLKKGASINKMGSLQPNNEQWDQAKIEMGDEIYENYKERGREIEDLNETINNTIKELVEIHTSLFDHASAMHGEKDVEIFDFDEIQGSEYFLLRGLNNPKTLQEILDGKWRAEIKNSKKDTLNYLTENIKRLQLIIDKFNNGYTLAFLTVKDDASLVTHPCLLKKGNVVNPDLPEEQKQDE